MKLTPVTCLLVLSVLGTAGAAAQTPVPPEPTDRGVSPYDRNPACRDRNVSGTDPACVIQDGPAVRQFGLGIDNTRPQPAVAPPQPAPASATPPVVIVVPPAGNSAISGSR